jgi:uncharacterized protein (TIRG00374 family)
MPGNSNRSSLFKLRLGTLLPVGLAVLFLFLALRGIDWEEVGQTLARVEGFYLALGLCLFSLSLLLRSLRWRNLLSARQTIQPALVFWTTAIGYLGNTFLPARAGEVVRSVVLGNKTGLSKSFVFATALTERVLDACVLVVTGLLLLPALGLLPARLKTLLWIIAALCGLAFACFACAPELRGLLTRLLAQTRLPAKWAAKIAGLAEQFSEGAMAFAHPLRAAVFFFITLAIWVLDGLGAVVLAKGMGLSLQFPQAVLFLIALGLSSAVPSTPGYVGLYQITAVTVLPGFGFSRSQALSFIFVLQSVNVAGVVVWGVLGLLRLGVKLVPGKEEQAV